MAKREEIKAIKRRIKPALQSLEDVATRMNLNGDKQAMRVLEAIGIIQSVMDEAEREAVN